jgi:hypothetical protein
VRRSSGLPRSAKQTSAGGDIRLVWTLLEGFVFSLGARDRRRARIIGD